ncbi:MAG: hypothetical protein WBC91_25040 [Phototrophicaceae bacterium]
MRRLFVLFLVALMALSTSVVMAQDSSDIITIELPDILVICPGQSVFPTAREFAELVVEFQDADDVMVVPAGVINESNGVTTITIGRVRLTCDSTASTFAQIDRSPAAPINTTLPQPNNLPGVAETQSGYLVVNVLNANLRSCDQPTCSRIAIVNNSDYLVVLGDNGATGDRLWWFVQAGDIRGWIWGDLVDGRGDLTDVPIVQTVGELAPATVYIGYTGNPLYNNLTASGQVICQVAAADNYPLLGRNSDTSWLWIEAQCVDGSTVQGWMNANNVAIRNTGNVFVPILNADGTAR